MEIKEIKEHLGIGDGHEPYLTDQKAIDSLKEAFDKELQTIRDSRDLIADRLFHSSVNEDRYRLVTVPELERQIGLLQAKCKDLKEQLSKKK